MRQILEAASIILTLCLSIPAWGETSGCPPPSPPLDGPVWISTELPLGGGDPPLSEEAVAALIRARLSAIDDGPALPESELHGEVVDETDLGVRSQVFLKSNAFFFEMLTETWTDDEGRFTLTGLPAGRFVVWTIEPGGARFALNLTQIKEHRARAVKLMLRPRCPDTADPD